MVIIVFELNQGSDVLVLYFAKSVIIAFDLDMLGIASF